MTEGTRANKPYKPTDEEKKATNELYKKWGMKPPFTEKARRFKFDPTTSATQQA